MPDDPTQLRGRTASQGLSGSAYSLGIQRERAGGVLLAPFGHPRATLRVDHQPERAAGRLLQVAAEGVAEAEQGVRAGLLHGRVAVYPHRLIRGRGPPFV